MKLEEAEKLLAKNGQSHLLGNWAKLKAPERKALLEQIAGIDFKAVARCAAVLRAQRDGTATAAKMGVFSPAPCVPALAAPWVPGAPTVLVCGKPLLNNSSKLICMSIL